MFSNPEPRSPVLTQSGTTEYQPPTPATYFTSSISSNAARCRRSFQKTKASSGPTTATKRPMLVKSEAIRPSLRPRLGAGTGAVRRLLEGFEKDRRRLNLLAAREHDRLGHPLELRVEVLLELGNVEALELDLGRHAQQVELLEDEGRYVAAEETEREEDEHAHQLAPQRDRDVVEPGGIAGREEADRERAPEAGDPVHRHRADGVVDPQPLLDEVAGVDGECAAHHRDEVIHRWRVYVRAGGDRDHPREPAGQGPEWVAAAGEVAAGEPARESDRDRVGDRRQRGRIEVDIAPTREDR